MAKISGYAVEPAAKVLIIREDTWAVEATLDDQLGNYEFTGLAEGKKSIVAVSSTGEVVGFGNVDAVAE